MPNWPTTGQANNSGGATVLEFKRPAQALAVPYVTARWEEELPGLLRTLRLPRYGVIQVGAHTGQEVKALTDCGFRRLVMVEPNRDHARVLRTELEQHHAIAKLPPPNSGDLPREVVIAAAGREPGEAVLHVTEYDQQASLLPPLAPMNVTRRDVTPVIPLRQVQHGCNVLVVDVQGAEIDVLTGCDLARLDLAVIEGSTWPRYEGGATVQTIASYMQSRGWQAVAAWAHVRPNVVDVAWLSPAFSAAAAA